MFCRKVNRRHHQDIIYALYTTLRSNSCQTFPDLRNESSKCWHELLLLYQKLPGIYRKLKIKTCWKSLWVYSNFLQLKRQILQTHFLVCFRLYFQNSEMGKISRYLFRNYFSQCLLGVNRNAFNKPDAWEHKGENFSQEKFRKISSKRETFTCVEA